MLCKWIAFFSLCDTTQLKDNNIAKYAIEISLILEEIVIVKLMFSL